MTRGFGDCWRYSGATLTTGVALLVVMGCASTGAMELDGTQRLAMEVRDVLGSERPSQDYQRARSRFQSMGPEVDEVLVELVEDTRARPHARANALILLADRDSPLALPILSRALGYEHEDLRTAAVIGLSRLAPRSDDALALVRAATRDRSRNVRLNALQGLDIREVDTIRDLLERESDPEVRQVAMQLVTLAESRGAPLVPDQRGALRTAGQASEPRIVFRPVSADTVLEIATGDLRVELPDAQDLPLAPAALVVGSVVPAFFSPDRSAVVAETDTGIRVVDIESRSSRLVGTGIAPRVIPFTQSFVYLRPKRTQTRYTPQGTEVRYDVFRSSFAGGEPELVGELRSWRHEDVHGGESPVRWMVVGDAGEGFVLRGDALETFPLTAAAAPVVPLR